MNIETWNKHYPVGTDVFFRVDHCEECHSVTASRAWTREDGTDVVKLQGVEGDFEFELSRLRPETIKHDIKHHETHHHPFGQMEQLPLNELLDMMASHGVAKVASVFSNQDDRPVFAVVLLTGEHIQDYLDAFDRIDEEHPECGVDKPADGHEGDQLTTGWEDAERISDLPPVHQALFNFSHDSTGDNATMVVQAVIEAAIPADVYGAWTSKEQQADAWVAISKLLSEVAPGWQHQTQKTGQQMAVDTIRALSTDAIRYRWLREKDNFPVDEGDGRTLWEDLCELDTADFDAWIDQRIAEDGRASEGDRAND